MVIVTINTWNRLSQKLFGFNYDLELVQVNGQPGIIYKLGSNIESVVAMDIKDNQIFSLYFMRNPNKLASFRLSSK